MLTVRLSFVQPLSLASLDSSPSRGASGEEEKFSAMPRPPIGRGGGSASALTERLSPAAAHGQALSSYNLSVSLRSTAPLVGEPLAKPFTLRGLPKPLLQGEVARRRRDGEVVQRRALLQRAGPSSYNLSVSLRSTAPLVGEPLAKPFTLRGLPKPPLLGEVARRRRDGEVVPGRTCP